MLSKILEQFDEKFVASNIGKIYNWKATALISCTEVRRFISQSIEQALNEVVKNIKCEKCNGSGAYSSPSSYEPCSDCEGTGFLFDGSANDITSQSIKNFLSN